MKNLKRKVLGLVAVVVVVAVGAVAVPWIYINLVKQDAPEALTLDSAVATTLEPAVSTTVAPEVGASALDGQWPVVNESVVGYRVQEVIVGQSTEGVGRTSAVEGSLTIVGDEVTSAKFTVDMTSLKSDSTRRDRQVNTRILDTSAFPTATFALKKPIKLTPEAIDGGVLSVKTTGTLTLRGVTRDIDFTLNARLVENVIEVNGSILLVFADWSIPDPSISAIVVEDRGQLEFLIRFSR
ncbi:MAG: YceI family protein [Actinobacteria bacterium]|nr:YceI family protein [Actinomycetota bacterium]